VDGFRASHAVVIGIDAYGNGIPPLRTAVNDARRIVRLLESGSGYSVRLLDEDVTLGRLRALFGECLPSTIEADDRLLVYFAGHGIAMDGDDGPAGYLVPQDARPDDRRTLLPMTELSGWLDRLPCRHLLLVLDCCFAGAFRWSSTRHVGAGPEVLHKERYDRYIRDPAWQVITSAAYDQKALDVVSGDVIGLRATDPGDPGHSPFAAAFLRGLEGEADLYPRAGPGRTGGDGVITATELYVHLRETVGAGRGGHRQTPGLWPLKKHDKGEYIHVVPGREPDLPPAPTLHKDNNPYRGLESYDEEHAPVFFGRGRFVEELAGRVAGGALTVVLGASGTGKSSIVKAGLLPHLRNGARADWEILSPIRPGKSPLASLASLSLPGEAADHESREGGFRADPGTLETRLDAWAARAPAGRLLLVVDQFEELITLCRDAREREQFLLLLDRALTAHPDRFRVVLTLRSDFEPQFAKISPRVEWASSRIVVPVMTLDDYREAIEGPASVMVLYFQGKTRSQAFIDRLIGDVANTPGALPLLSFALSELYRCYLERGGDDRSLREEDYERLGGVGGSLRNRANEIHDDLPDDATRATMCRLTLRMISVEAGDLARRRVPRSELDYRDPGEDARVKEVLDRLVEARLAVGGIDIDGQPYVEPAHDELIRGWDRLLEWARGGQEALLLRRILTPAAEDWRRGSGGLWDANPRLNLLKETLGSEANWLNRTESEFVESSIRRRLTIRLTAVGAVTLAFVILATATLIALQERKNAEERRVLSETGRYDSDLARSQLAWESNQPGLIEQLLDVHDPAKTPGDDHRGFEWWHWNNLLRVRMRTYRGHGDRVNGVAFRPDGRWIASASDDRTVRVWDAANGRELANLGEHPSPVSAVAFSSDGGRLASGARDGTVRIWDGAVPGRPRTVGFPGVEILGLAFSPDGGRVAVAADDGAIRICDVAAAGVDRTLPSRGVPVNGVAYSPDGRLLASAEDDGLIRIWDADAAAVRRTCTGHKAAVEGLAFRRDGRLASGSSDGTVRIWDPVTAVATRILETGGHGVNGVAFSPDGRLLACAAVDGAVRIWDADGGRALRTLKGHVGSATGVAFSPDGRHIVGSGVDGRLRLWDAAVGQEPLRLRSDDPRPVVAVDFHPDGRRVATAQRSGAVRIWDMATGRDRPAPPGHRGGANALAFSRDGRLLASAGEDGLVQMRDVACAGAPRTCAGHADSVNAVAFRPDGRILASGSSDGTVRIWDVDTAGERHRLAAGGRGVNGVAFSADGRRLASAGDDGLVRLWDPEIGNELRPLDGRGGRVNGVAFSVDGRLIASVAVDGAVRIWDLNTRRLRPPSSGHSGSVDGVTFSPDGRRLASAAQDRTVRLWDPITGQEVLRLDGGEGPAHATAFSRDGRRLALAAHDGTVWIWDATVAGTP
jgi:WD40 repeat protein